MTIPSETINHLYSPWSQNTVLCVLSGDWWWLLVPSIYYLLLVFDTGTDTITDTPFHSTVTRCPMWGPAVASSLIGEVSTLIIDPQLWTGIWYLVFRV